MKKKPTKKAVTMLELSKQLTTLQREHKKLARGFENLVGHFDDLVNHYNASHHEDPFGVQGRVVNVFQVDKDGNPHAVAGTSRAGLFEFLQALGGSDLMKKAQAMQVDADKAAKSMFEAVKDAKPTALERPTKETP